MGGPDDHAPPGQDGAVGAQALLQGYRGEIQAVQQVGRHSGREKSYLLLLYIHTYLHTVVVQYVVDPKDSAPDAAAAVVN